MLTETSAQSAEPGSGTEPESEAQLEHEAGPESEAGPAPESEGAPAGARTRRRWLAIGVVALVVCLVIAAAGYVIRLSDDGGTASDPPGQLEPPHTASAPIDGRDEPELHLVSGATVVTVAMASMGETLYEVTTPPDGDSVPRTVDQGDQVEVHLVPTGEPGPSSVTITLSTEVRWNVLRLSGGANEQRLDLTGGAIARVELAAGATRIELTLPVPEGTVPVRVSAGAGDLVLHTPTEVPVQATLNSGAGTVTLDGERHTGIAPGSVFTPDDWEDAEHRYDLDSAGLGQLTITRDG